MSDEPAATLFLLGASHHTAPLAVREKLALGPGAVTALCARLRALPGLREFAVLNTCNRVEFYGVAAGADTAARLQAAFCEQQAFDPAAFEKIRLHLRGRDALQHLLEVAAGLDSQMIGEAEILGQVKAAYAEAQARRSAGPVLHRVFQKSFQAAKHVRTHTAIGEGPLSVAGVAVDLAQKIFGDLRRTRIFVLGAGEIGEKTAKALKSRGAANLTIASRRMQRAEEMAAALEARALLFDQMPEALSGFDIVVCSTTAPDVIIPARLAAAAMRHRPTQPLFFIDLALPRDVDPEVVRLPNVFLYNLDDLAKIAADNLAQRQAEIALGRAFLAEKAAALWPQLAAPLAAAGGVLPPPPEAGLRAAHSL
jgi:glutamyl-tRNA reductase